MANTHNFSLWQQRLVRALCWSLVLGALAVVFGWYLEPDFMLTMADHVWACF